ncbi:MAG: putative zinc-binding protein [Nitrosomonadales bacterium]|nr:putative zinc-binding protein [Nitrosomonadales bacterium]
MGESVESRYVTVEGTNMSQRRIYKELPLVYSCSGCSSAAQTANYIALKLDRDGVAEMSCISGVGGDVPHLVKIARSGRPIVALDGCPLACTLHCLAQRGLSADYYLQLHEHGVKKKYHADFDHEHADRIANAVAIEARRLHSERQP